MALGPCQGPDVSTRRAPPAATADPGARVEPVPSPSAPRPRILVATTSDAHPIDKDKEADYCAFVEGAGGEPVVVHLDTPVPKALELLGSCDGLLLAGGPDVDPSRYRAASHEKTEPEPGRDELEFALLEAAVADELPVLGICRGLQVINVFRGGTLHQHLPEKIGDDRHAGSLRHDVVLDPRTEGSRLARALGAPASASGRVTVTSSHHQAADVLGRGLSATAWSVEVDGRQPVVEALEDEDVSGPFLVGVQWHPERLAPRPDAATGEVGILANAVRERGARGFEELDPPQYGLARAFVDAARARVAARARP